MNWKIYYSNGMEVSDHDNTPWGVQLRTGVQVIIQADFEHGWKSITGGDFYLWDVRDGDVQARWYPANIHDLSFYLGRPGYKCVLFGEFVGTKRYREILNKALTDMEFAQKNGWGAEERRE